MRTDRLRPSAAAIDLCVQVRQESPTALRVPDGTWNKKQTSSIASGQGHVYGQTLVW